MASLRFAFVALIASVAADGPDQDTPTRYSTKMNTLEEKKQIAEEGCSHVPKRTLCRLSCFYKSIGVVDGSGRYIESAAVDLLRIKEPENIRVDDAVKQTAATCNSVNDHIEKGCNRAQQIDGCVSTEYDKIINQEKRAAMMAQAKEICTEGRAECHKSCMFNIFEVVSNQGTFDAEAAMDLLAITYPGFNINKLRTIGEICGRRVGKTLDGCENADTVWKCFEEEYAQETGQQTTVKK